VKNWPCGSARQSLGKGKRSRTAARQCQQTVARSSRTWCIGSRQMTCKRMSVGSDDQPPSSPGAWEGRSSSAIVESVRWIYRCTQWSVLVCREYTTYVRTYGGRDTRTDVITPRDELADQRPRRGQSRSGLGWLSPANQVAQSTLPRINTPKAISTVHCHMIQRMRAEISPRSD
jgi:hypothetical protein